MTNKSGNTKRAARRERAHDRRPLGSRFQDTNRQTRAGGGLPEGEEGVEGCCLPAGITHDLVLQIDLPARRMEREARLLEMHGGDVNKTLHDICREGGGKDARFLLAHGADANGVGFDRETRVTVLACAAYNGHLPVTEALLDAGAGQLERALNWAVDNQGAAAGRMAIITLLLDRGADIHHNNDVALWFAVQNGCLETVTLLLARGATAMSKHLTIAAHRGHTEVAALLRAHGAV